MRERPGEALPLLLKVDSAEPDLLPPTEAEPPALTLAAPAVAVPAAPVALCETLSVARALREAGTVEEALGHAESDRVAPAEREPAPLRVAEGEAPVDAVVAAEEVTGGVRVSAALEEAPAVDEGGWVAPAVYVMMPVPD